MRTNKLFDQPVVPDVFVRQLKKSLILYLLLVVFVSAAFAEGKISRNLFSEALSPQYVSQGDVSAHSQIIRSRLANIHLDILNKYTISDPLILNLFADSNLKMSISKVQRTRSQGMALIGQIENITESGAIIVVNGNVVSANIFVPGHFYQVRSTSAESYVIQEIDQSQFPAELPPVAPDIQGDVTRGLTVAAADVSPVVDVLVVYTSAARQGAGSVAAMENLIDLAIAETNTGYANSGVLQRLRLIHTEEVVYDESGLNWSTTLGRLKGSSDGYMDSVHSLRDLHAADEVVLIVNNYDSCGIAYVMQFVSTSFSSNAFAVVSRNCATGYYSFAHELGHNMGSAHDRANASVTGAYSYSYGYQEPDEAFRSIMAYNCPGGCTRVNYWSNPDELYGGQPMGVLYTAPLAADNHRSLNDTGPTVAAFRTAVTPVTPGMSVEPLQWNYGRAEEGTSFTKSFVVTNTSAVQLDISATNITGDTDFSIESGGGPFSLNAGATRQIVIRWSPTSKGVMMATLGLTHNAGGTNPLNISLWGEGGYTFPWPIFIPSFLIN